MSVREFTVLLAGLPPDAAFVAALDEIPQTADSPEAIAAAFGSYLG